MSLTNLLVHVDPSSKIQVGLSVAVALAEQHHCMVSGLYVRPPMNIPILASSVTGDMLAASLQQEADSVAAATHDMFDSTVGGRVRAQWFENVGVPRDCLTHAARFADLVLLGQASIRQGPGERRLAAAVAEHSGRPVMLVPESASAPFVCERILVAWNGSREAARAVSDSLPLLKKAKSVEVLIITAEAWQLEDGQKGSGIVAFLAGHGVSSTVKLLPFQPSYGVSGLILARAEELSADLVVMGSHGRTKLRETVLGGVTDEVLEKNTAMTLLSH